MVFSNCLVFALGQYIIINNNFSKLCTIMYIVHKILKKPNINGYVHTHIMYLIINGNIFTLFTTHQFQCLNKAYMYTYQFYWPPIENHNITVITHINIAESIIFIKIFVCSLDINGSAEQATTLIK